MKTWLQHLHEGAEWYRVPEAQKNSFQRIAARTWSIVTPANIVTLLGAGLVLGGLWFFRQGSLATGFWLIGIGRWFDIFDGHIARLTKTSSPFGEGLDAAFDKLVILMAAVVLVSMHVMPLLIVVLLLLEQMATAGLTLLARRHGVLLHPTRFGKYTTFGVWIIILLYLVSFWLEARGKTGGTFVYDIATVAAGVMIALRVWALSRYVQAVRQEAKKGSTNTET